MVPPAGRKFIANPPNFPHASTPKLSGVAQKRLAWECRLETNHFFFSSNKQTVFSFFPPPPPRVFIITSRILERWYSTPIFSFPWRFWFVLRVSVF